MSSVAAVRRRADAALIEAGQAAMISEWRRCADKYLEAYTIADSGWVAKYNCWSGYTAVLKEDHFKASEDDLKALKRVAKDETAPRLDRFMAHFAHGYVQYSLGNRESAGRSYRRAIEVGKGATAAERARKVLLPDERTLQYMEKPSGPLFDATLQTAGENLASMEKRTPQQLNFDPTTTAEQIASRFAENLKIGHPTAQAFSNAFEAGMPKFFTPLGAKAALTQEEFVRLTTVGGSACDHCGVSRSSNALLRCSRCGLAYYCNKDCQKAQWKMGHKHACRAPDEIKVGDRVQLQFSSENWRELYNVPTTDPTIQNGMLVEVRKAASNKGYWDVGMIGGEAHCTLPVSATELKRLRPVA